MTPSQWRPRGILLHGHGAPVPNLGRECDIYLDLGSRPILLYGPRTNDPVSPWGEPISLGGDEQALLDAHINSPTPHPVYDNVVSFVASYRNQKV